MSEQFGKLDQALEDLKQGKLILVIDDPDRENEGDLICAAEHATPENVNAMASLAKGLICMPASFIRSTVASVCPARFNTPPSRACNGNI